MSSKTTAGIMMQIVYKIVYRGFVYYTSQNMLELKSVFNYSLLTLLVCYPVNRLLNKEFG